MNELNENQLNKIIIKGFKSINESEIDLKNINVLIGSNGAGKSNFISIFEMLQKISEQHLSSYAQHEGAGTLFFNSSKITESISVEFYFGSSKYYFELYMTKHNSLNFVGERFGSENSPWAKGDHDESKLYEWYNDPNIDKNAVKVLLNKQWRTFHFNDSHFIIKPKNYNISNSDFLQKDAANLAAFLYRLQEYYKKEYKNILSAIQIIAPYFEDFVLKPEEGNNEHIILRWQKKDCDEIFNAAQLSDGTLRFICLATLLLQPSELQPETIIIDEPELGLHPFAITIFSEMIQKAAASKQIIIATQSVELLDHFSFEDVIVVDCDSNGSKFKRLDYEELKIWLDDYTLGELWNKNILGGRFAR